MNTVNKRSLSDSSTYVPEKVVERRNVANTFNGWNFFQKLKLQEPTFKELVIVYRHKYKDPLQMAHHAVQNKHRSVAMQAEKYSQGRSAKKTSRIVQLRRTFEELTKKEELRPPRRICIKSFSNIPRADLEVIFPEKSLHMNPIDVVQLWMVAITALVAGILQAFSSVDEADSSSYFVPAFSLLVAAVSLAIKIYFQFNTKRTIYSQNVTNTLYHRTLDNQHGLIANLIDTTEVLRVV